MNSLFSLWMRTNSTQAPSPLRTPFSPSPQPSPLGRGRSVSDPFELFRTPHLVTHCRPVSLPPRERVGVRGNNALLNPRACNTPNAQPHKSSTADSGFPEPL